MADAEGRGFYRRGYLPHIDQPGLVQLVTFRLADALPETVVAKWIDELEARCPDDSESERRQQVLRARIERYADAGHGACTLGDPQAGRAVEDALLHFDGTQYRLLAWVVMPNHVHVVFETVEEHPLAAVVGAWKSVSARRVNAAMGRVGTLWQRDYYDRVVRDPDQLRRVVGYVEANPAIAGLVTDAELWPFSSARVLERRRPRRQRGR